MKKAIYAGSFDPPTNGHLWMIWQGAKLFDKLIVVIGKNPKKKYTFSIEDRLKMLNDIIKEEYVLKDFNIEVVDINTQMVVNFAEDINAEYIIRGIRSNSDFEYEKNIYNINANIKPFVNTIFLIPPKIYEDISSSLVKGLIGYVGWENVVAKYVPPTVFNKLKEGVK